jgi:NAD(P)-dependent dehydrogenase (short-subunit alcohol dehydrogenase family)
MNIASRTVLITGANRGIGRALVDEALKRGAQKVYAAARRPLPVADDRVRPLSLDVTDLSQIRRAAEQVDSLDVLINNAGVAIYDDLSNATVITQHLAVNLFGIVNMTGTFLPLLTPRAPLSIFCRWRGLRRCRSSPPTLCRRQPRSI